MPAKLKWDCSAVVAIDGDGVFAEDRKGNVIRQGRAGADDADVVQAAVDAVDPGGKIQLTRGTYVFTKTVTIYNNSTLVGEGRGTVIVPPPGEYALWVGTTEKTSVYRPYHGDPGPLYAFIIRDLTIDGKTTPDGNKGKGIRMEHFWSALVENLWISDTGCGLYLRHCKESDFSNIHLIANGDEKAREASLIMTGENNNVHFRGLFVVYPNYVGMDLIGTLEEGIEVPRLVFVTQGMFHGWLREEGAAQYDLIRVTDLDAHRVGCLADFVIRDSRITVAGRDRASVNAINSPVTVANSVITATRGKYVIRASKAARVTITGNTYHGGSAEGSQYALHAEDAEVLFKDNTLNGRNLKVHLAPASNSIIADNRFVVEGDGPTVWVGDNGATGSSHVDVRGNMFCEKHAGSAVSVSPLAAKSGTVRIGENHYAGNYSDQAVVEEKQA